MTPPRDNGTRDIDDLSEQELDACLSEYLEGKSAVSAVYKNEADAVPAAHIDSAILFNAREQADALADKGSSWTSYFQQLGARWFGTGLFMPAATACGVVGVASAMFMLQPSDSTVLEPVPSSNSRSVDDDAPLYTSPELYLEEIHKLRERGKQDEADQLTLEMNRAYPGNNVLHSGARSRIDD